MIMMTISCGEKRKSMELRDTNPGPHMFDINMLTV